MSKELSASSLTIGLSVALGGALVYIFTLNNRGVAAAPPNTTVVIKTDGGSGHTSDSYYGNPHTGMISRPGDFTVPPGRMINVPTRGAAPPYQQVGILTKAGEDTTLTSPTILPLFGHQTYSGSNKWQYYAATDKFNMMKIPVQSKKRNCLDEVGCDELYENDVVYMPQYSADFTVTMYQFQNMNYIP